MNTITPKLKALLKAEWQHSMTYPGMIIIWVFDMFFIPLIFLLIWRSIVNTNPALQANESSITLYYILMPLVSLLTSAWHAPFFANDVRDGRLSTRLLKPLTPHAYTFIHSLTEKMVKMLFLLPMVVIGIIAYPISIDFSISTFLLCVVSVILGGVIKYLIEEIISFFAFWTDDVVGFKFIFEAAFQMLGGRLIPLFLFPPLVRSLSNLLPFRYIISFPLEILSGQVSSLEIQQGFLLQVSITTILFGFTAILWHRGIIKYSAIGG